jgi:DNA-binding transcriptional LysR family regulator
MHEPSDPYAGRMNVQFRHLEALLAVVEAGTFTGAAERLGMSQAAVSRSVAALETALGARLLQRTTRHVALTPAGARIADQARRVLDELTHLHRIADQARAEIRVGYAWAALGRHTRRLQRAWAAAHPGLPLVFVHSNEPTAGLGDGSADVAVIRRELSDRRFDTARVGTERRFAAVATDNPLARKRSVSLADVARHTVAIDYGTGTTTPDLWATPPVVRPTHSLDEWLTLIAAGQAVGITSEATANQNPRPGIAYRPVRDATPIPVRLAWWRDDPPAELPELITQIRATYTSPAPR